MSLPGQEQSSTILYVSPEDRLRLSTILSNEGPEKLHRRARIVLLYADGHQTADIVRLTGLSPSCVRTWRRRFRTRGMAIFPPEFRAGVSQNVPGAGRQVEQSAGAAAPNPSGRADQVQEEISLMPPEAKKSGHHLFPNSEARQLYYAHVAKLAESLFDMTRGLHGLGDEHRQVLRLAAECLADLDQFDQKNTPKKLLNWIETRCLPSSPAGSSDWNSSPPLPGESKGELALILAQFTGKTRHKTPAHPSDSAAQEGAAVQLAALLEIADGLNTSASQSTQLLRVEPAPDGLWLVVSGPQADLDALAAQKRMRLWSQTQFPAVRVLESEQAEDERRKLPPLPAPRQNPGVHPDDQMAEAGRKVLLFHFAEMLRNEAGTRQGEDIEALHDMRVATRRMRAAFEVFGEAFEPKALKPHLKGLRATGRALGQVRDLDVFMEKAQKYLETLPEEQRCGLDPLLNHWKVQREAVRAAMLAHLDSPQYQIFKQAFNQFLQTPGAGVIALPEEQPTPRLVREIAPILIYTRLAAVRAYDAILAEASTEQLHALRIEFKKFRYTVEFFREVLGDEAQAVINDLKKIQDHLGDLNDAQVATQNLRQFLDEWESQQAQLAISARKSSEGIVNYLAAQHARRYELTTTFLSVWQHFNRREFLQNLAEAVAAI